MTFRILYNQGGSYGECVTRAKQRETRPPQVRRTEHRDSSRPIEDKDRKDLLGNKIKPRSEYKGPAEIQLHRFHTFAEIVYFTDDYSHSCSTVRYPIEDINWPRRARRERIKKNCHMIGISGLFLIIMVNDNDMIHR